MSDDLAHFHPLDPGRINVMDPVEIKYWCNKLHCNEAQLRLAMAKVGDHVTAVRGQLASESAAG